MSGYVESLKSALAENIALHESLKAIIENERRDIQSGGFSILTVHNAEKTAIQRKIDVVSRKIQSIAEAAGTGTAGELALAGKELKLLMVRLNEVVRSAQAAITETMTVMGDAKKELARDMKSMHTRKIAVGAYMRNMA